jgi:hypothetical protein
MEDDYVAIRDRAYPHFPPLEFSNMTMRLTCDRHRKQNVRAMGKALVTIGLVKSIPPPSQLRLERHNLAVSGQRHHIGATLLVREFACNLDHIPRRGVAAEPPDQVVS